MEEETGRGREENINNNPDSNKKKRGSRKEVVKEEDRTKKEVKYRMEHRRVVNSGWRWLLQRISSLLLAAARISDELCPSGKHEAAAGLGEAPSPASGGEVP